MPAGIRIKHATLSNCIYLVPVLRKPYTTGPIDCPTCQTFHPVKTVHLWLEPDGTVIVSPGVLAELKMAKMPELTVVNEVQKPPPLALGRRMQTVQDRREWRAGQDQQNRATNLWWSKLGKKKEAQSG